MDDSLLAAHRPASLSYLDGSEGGEGVPAVSVPLLHADGPATLALVRLE